MAKCTPCLSQKVKTAINKSLNDRDIENLLNTIPDCIDGVEIELCVKGKRPLSKYQMHMSKCLLGGGSIKTCAVDWKKKK
jgi:hypothetical protein